ncbi:unnamed protein product, partial [Protopolystoma xenopodis]
RVDKVAGFDKAARVDKVAGFDKAVGFGKAVGVDKAAGAAGAGRVESVDGAAETRAPASLDQSAAAARHSHQPPGRAAQRVAGGAQPILVLQLLRLPLDRRTGRLSVARQEWTHLRPLLRHVVRVSRRLSPHPPRCGSLAGRQGQLSVVPATGRPSCPRRGGQTRDDELAPVNTAPMVGGNHSLDRLHREPKIFPLTDNSPYSSFCQASHAVLFVSASLSICTHACACAYLASFLRPIICTELARQVLPTPGSCPAQLYHRDSDRIETRPVVHLLPREMAFPQNGPTSSADA